MFFRRVFSNSNSNSLRDDTSSIVDVFDDGQSMGQSSSYYSSNPFSIQSSTQSSGFSDTSSVKRLQRQLSVEDNRPFQKGLFVLQLTPLWEHIIRTNSLPPHLNVSDMFNEFQERLQENEWQVRQHALRVLVDVLIVMGQQADYHVGNIIHSLVDNLGHIAPAVRKCTEF